MGEVGSSRLVRVGYGLKVLCVSGSSRVGLGLVRSGRVGLVRVGYGLKVLCWSGSSRVGSVLFGLVRVGYSRVGWGKLLVHLGSKFVHGSEYRGGS